MELHYYAINNYGKQRLSVKTLDEAWERVNTENYYKNNPIKYIQEVRVIKFYPEDFE